jgi:hypothetical protein
MRDPSSSISLLEKLRARLEDDWLFSEELYDWVEPLVGRGSALGRLERLWGNGS